MKAAGDHELIFVLAATGQVGAEALTKRVLRKLEDSEHIEYGDLVFTLTNRCLGEIGCRAHESRDVCRARSAAMLQQIMDEELLIRTKQSV